MFARPIDLPLLRKELLERVAYYGPPMYTEAIEKDLQAPRISGPPNVAGPMMARRECQRIDISELFYVNKDMIDLSVVAEQSLPEFTLMPEDLPAEFGFIVFEEPIDIVTVPGEHESAIVAAVWGRWYDAPKEWELGGVWITWYIDTGRWVETDPRYNDEQAENIKRGYGRLTIEIEAPQPFHKTPLPVWDCAEQKTMRYQESDGAIHWVGILKTIWLLMKQTIGHVESAHFDRATLRRMTRHDIKPQQVRIITLRRRSNGGDGHVDREYHHQWLVRGHWRQQWYPSRDVHRPIWIAPHIKGPEGAPLLGGEKVYALQR